MQKTIHKATDRGTADLGWLHANYSFSFAGYYNPERMHFGLLRVLNDDIIDPGAGFGMHPHENMEIVSIPIKGALKHEDSKGHKGIIKAGDVQVMSAGTGIYHSEHNASKEEPINMLQIWVFPKEKNIEPRYGQKTFPAGERKNKWQTVVAPDDDNALWINQDAWFNLSEPEKGKSLNYKMHRKESGAYIFIIEGAAEVAGEQLQKRDAIGLYGTGEVEVEPLEDSKILLIEVPMR